MWLVKFIVILCIWHSEHENHKLFPITSTMNLRTIGFFCSFRSLRTEVQVCMDTTKPSNTACLCKVKTKSNFHRFYVHITFDLRCRKETESLSLETHRSLVHIKLIFFIVLLIRAVDVSFSLFLSFVIFSLILAIIAWF